MLGYSGWSWVRSALRARRSALALSMAVLLAAGFTLPVAAQHFVDVPGSSPTRKHGAHAAPAAMEEVILLTATWCPHCPEARGYLAQHGIDYVEYDIDTPEGAEVLESFGEERRVPLLAVGSRRYFGFSDAGYDAFFRAIRSSRRRHSHGNPSTAP